MGLFDAYDPNTYAPSQGGLIDRLLASGALQAPTDQGPGFPQSPMDAQASAPAPQPAQPQNAPIAVGNYQMPRIGSGFDLPAGTLDPATGEHVTGPAPQQPQQAAPAAPSPGIGDRLKTSLQSATSGGGLIGGVASLFDGQLHGPQAQRAARVQQLATSLAGAGLAPQQAQQLATIHAIDPEAGRALIEKALGPQSVQSLGNGYVWDPRQNKAVKAYEPDDKFKVVQTGETGLGGKQFEVFNPADGSHTPIKSAADIGNNGLGDMSKTGADYLATIPPQQAGIVKAMVEGRQAPPSSFALSKPYWQNMIAAAQQYDPTFDATNWGGRVAGVKDFASGKSAEMVRSANQTLQHVNALLDSADALHNGNYPSLNWVGNKFNEATGGGEPGAFKTNAHAVADEMSKVFKGGNLSDSEIRAWEENLSPNMSPAQQKAQIGKLSELLHGSLQALDEKRVASIGQAAADKAGPIIKPAGQAVLQRIDAWLKAGASNGAGNTTKSGVQWSVEK